MIILSFRKLLWSPNVLQYLHNWKKILAQSTFWLKWGLNQIRLQTSFPTKSSYDRVIPWFFITWFLEWQCCPSFIGVKFCSQMLSKAKCNCFNFLVQTICLQQLRSPKEKKMLEGRERYKHNASKSDEAVYIVLSTWTVLFLLCDCSVQLPGSMMSICRQSPRSLHQGVLLANFHSFYMWKQLKSLCLKIVK